MDVLVKALSLMAIIVLGQLIRRWGWVGPEDFDKFVKIVLRITLPCALVTAFNDYEMPPSLLGIALIGFLLNLLLQLGGWLFQRGRGPREQAFGVINVASFNMGAFATPYLAGFMGPTAVVQASIFDIGNAFGAAGLGYAWATGMADEGHRTTLRSFLRAMFSSVVFDVYLALVAMQLLHIRLPEAVITLTSTVGAANTFLAMLMIGIGLQIRLERHQYRSAARLLGVRYGLATMAAIGIWFSPLAQDLRVLLCVVAFAPIAAMSPGFTAEIKGDVGLSTFMSSVSIIVGVVMMPALLMVLA